ncbi:MAG: response regulator transcription factor [Sulfurovaceae bacterium]|nr:response regulator transcription factor [Sulfurovaceae bacterium]
MQIKRNKFGTKILLLEDDYTLNEIITEFLEERGFIVISAYDGEEVFDIIYENAFDIFLFDVKVPIQNGFDILKELRKTGIDTPTIFITSLFGINDVSTAFEIGCDDYLRKPFELQELYLRINSILKRNFDKYNQQIEISHIVSFDFKNGKLLMKDAEEIILQAKEANILKTLLQNSNNIVTNEILIKSAWSFDETATEDSLRTHIKNLRKYIGKEYIQNIRGRGYMLVKN